MADFIQDNGVVGAGGAGFPTAVKLQAKVSTFIVNAAECEPLLHKDKELLANYPDEFFKGLETAMSRTGADQAVIGIKNKYHALIDSLQGSLPRSVKIHPLDDIYPAGDEFILVYDITGKIIPPGGLPLQVGCVVNNVETLVNIGLARPVISKFVTIAGAVKDPCTLNVPLGTPISQLISAAGGVTSSEYGVLVGGVMMGRLLTDPHEPVTKTTGGVLVFPADHILLKRYGRTQKMIDRIGRSACDQCSMCTEKCPRYLLGHPIEPHKAMRALGFAPEKDRMIMGTLYCCECNLCSFVSCPEDLDPRSVCAQAKTKAREKNLKWAGSPQDIQSHTMLPYRRTPTRILFQKLDLNGFTNKAPLQKQKLSVSKVVLPLRQHVGVACEPVVKIGQAVREGELIAKVPEGKLGAPLHASISGTIKEITGTITIEAN